MFKNVYHPFLLIDFELDKLGYEMFTEKNLFMFLAILSGERSDEFRKRFKEEKGFFKVLSFFSQIFNEHNFGVVSWLTHVFGTKPSNEHLVKEIKTSIKLTKSPHTSKQLKLLLLDSIDTMLHRACKYKVKLDKTLLKDAFRDEQLFLSNGADFVQAGYLASYNELMPEEAMTALYHSILKFGSFLYLRKWIHMIIVLAQQDLLMDFYDNIISIKSSVSASNDEFLSSKFVCDFTPEQLAFIRSVFRKAAPQNGGELHASSCALCKASIAGSGKRLLYIDDAEERKTASVLIGDGDNSTSTQMLCERCAFFIYDLKILVEVRKSKKHAQSSM